VTLAPKIFVSYRRDDAPGSAGRLYDRLADAFPREAIFMDVDAMVPGVDFVREIDEAVIACDVLLAVIGRNWHGTAASDGVRRIDNPDDFVRIEIASALQHGIRVVPVLVDGAQMPAADDLPDDLKPLARRHAVEISHMRFAADAERLVRPPPWPRSLAQASPEASHSCASSVPLSPYSLSLLPARWRICGRSLAQVTGWSARVPLP
jgi:hypothetical protein